MSRVKAGEAYVEIGGDPRKLFATLSKVQRQIGQMGSAFSATGRQMMAVGAGLAAPFGVAVAAGSRFEDVLLNVRASTGATAAELDQVKAAAMAMSQSLGVGPTEAAAGFLELLKAGMSLEDVLGGAGEAAIAFAKVGGMAVADASVVMADAMNVFRVTADVAANTLSAAADASSTSIEGIAMAFSQVSAVAGLANQSIQDTATALAVLANAGVKGSDAGTSLKTMLMRLMAPADDAVGALQQLGLTVQSFRNADGSMKPLVDIIGTLTTAMEGMDQAAKDDIFRRIFGQDAIRAAAVLTAAGVDGFQAMQDGMGGAMTVGDKFATMSSGLSGAVSTLRAAMERLAISVSDAVGPAIMGMAQAIGPVIDGIAKFATANKELVGQIAKGVTIFTASGVGLFALGKALSFVSSSFGGLLSAAGGVFQVLRVVASGALFVAMSFVKAVAGVVAFSAASVASAMASGAAWATANAPLLILVGLLAGLGVMAVSAMGGLQGIADAVTGGLTGALSDATVVFGDLAKTATSTFNGIYDAIAEGDLSGAMDILWAGLQAGWLRGVEAIMGYVDPWISMFQNVFTILGASIFKVWDTIWVNVSNSFNTFGAYLMGAFDNVINGVMAAWDALEAGVRKSWNYVQSFFKKGFDLKKENNKVDSEMTARARKRELERPGVEGRTKKAAAENEKALRDRDARAAGVDENTNAIIAGREAENQRRRDERRAATRAAEDRATNAVRDKRETRGFRAQADDAIGRLASAQTRGDIDDIVQEFWALAETGKLTEEQMAKFREAVGEAGDRVESARGEAGIGAAEPVDPEQVRQAAMDAAASQAEVAGTFSAQAISGMGFGQSLQQKANELLGRIEQNTRQDPAIAVAP